MNFNQNDWVNYLFIVEFEINFVKFNSIAMKFFLTIKDFLFKSNLKSRIIVKKIVAQKREMRVVDEIIEKQHIFKKYLREKLKWFQTFQEKQINKKRHSIIELRVNDMIMLDFKNLKIARSNKNLNYKNLKFFKIIRVINNSVYELKLSNNMQNIYSMFYLWLLHLINVNFFSNQK